jgi:hypothetical protein
MNYNQPISPDFSSQEAHKLTYMLGEQFKKLLAQPEERELFKEEPQPLKPKPPQGRTSEDDRLDYLGYNY